MLDNPIPLSESQFDQLARLHVSCLPESGIGVLGLRYARQFYRYIAHTRTETLFCCLEETQIVAAAIVSDDATALLRRLWWRTPLIWECLSTLPTQNRWRSAKALWPRAAKHSIDQSVTPELIFIFTAALTRRRGLGSKLLVRVEQHLRRLGHRRYVVRGQGNAANPATQFYASLEFSILPNDAGIRFWQKEID